jgi:hypothetical protein
MVQPSELEILNVVGSSPLSLFQMSASCLYRHQVLFFSREAWKSVKRILAD